MYSWIFPSGPTGTMTRFGMFCPGWKFRFEVCCRSAPDGHTVMYPAAVGLATVTFKATADTPVAGTRPCPVTCTEIDPVERTGPGAPWLIRVSMIRAGDNDAKEPAGSSFVNNDLYVAAAFGANVALSGKRPNWLLF